MPFELGRPLGAPNDAPFQRRVLMAAFDLLDASSGPMLADYPEEAPADAADEGDATEGLVCPISLPRPPDASARTNEIGRALLAEIGALMPWYDLAVRGRGRTTVGASGLSVEAAAGHLAAFLEDPDTPPPRDDMPSGRVLKLAYEDLKAFHGEAVTAQPGFGGSSQRVEGWLFNETVLGQALWRLRGLCRASDDEYLQYLGRNSIVPDRQVGAAE